MPTAACCGNRGIHSLIDSVPKFCMPYPEHVYSSAVQNTEISQVKLDLAQLLYEKLPWVCKDKACKKTTNPSKVLA